MLRSDGALVQWRRPLTYTVTLHSGVNWILLESCRLSFDDFVPRLHASIEPALVCGRRGELIRRFGFAADKVACDDAP